MLMNGVRKAAIATARNGKKEMERTHEDVLFTTRNQESEPLPRQKRLTHRKNLGMRYDFT